MNCGFPRRSILLAVFSLFGAGAPAFGQDKLEITAEVIERFLKAYAAEEAERDKVAAEHEELEEKIRRFDECAEALRVAGSVTGRVGGLAAKAAMKAKCGATSDEGFRKDQTKLASRPEEAALSAGRFKSRQYTVLTERLIGFMAGADGDYSKAEREAIDARRADLSTLLAGEIAQARLAYGGGDDGRAGRRRGPRNRPNVWTDDVAWEYINEMIGMMYLGHIVIQEKPYEPGAWTRWEHSESWAADEKTVFERAFLGKTPEGNEWWRVKTVELYKAVDGKEVADTAVLEGLFKPVEGQVQMRELVRLRARLPGQKEGNEMIVPKLWSAFSALASWAGEASRPTEESIEAATTDAGKVTTPAGTFAARRVKFAGGDGGTNEWLLSDAVPGGWLRFAQVTPIEEPAEGDPAEDRVLMELIAHGKGAKSELGVM